MREAIIILTIFRLLEQANHFNNGDTRKQETGSRPMQESTYHNAIKALKLARKAGNRAAARAALARAKVALALIHLGYN